MANIKFTTVTDATRAAGTPVDGEYVWTSDTKKLYRGDGSTAGGIAISSSGITLGGALGTPSSGTLTNCTGLPVSGITASTSTALGVGSIELGHASDTTLSRASAGVLAVEGVNVVTVSGTQTLTNKTIGAAALSGTLDGGGQEIGRCLNRVVTSVTGTLTVAAHSGCILKTSGNITVPTTAGFNAVIIAGGAHTVTFNSTVSAAMAAGDVMTVFVESATVIHAVKTAAADKVAFA